MADNSLKPDGRRTVGWKFWWWSEKKNNLDCNASNHSPVWGVTEFLSGN